MPSNRWIYYSKTLFSSKRSLSFLTIAILIISVPLTVFVLQYQQDIRQRASSGTPTTRRVQQTSVVYPWQYARSGMGDIPSVPQSTKELVANLPNPSATCVNKSRGDADCNNSIDLGDLSYWQLDYEKNIASHADFNGDKKVNLTDFAIWQQNASLARESVVQKVSQKLGINTVFLESLWKSIPPYQFTVLAAETQTPEITDSTLQVNDSVYQIVNEYSNNTYSIRTAETAKGVGQEIYYSDTGEQLAMINNYFTDASTITTQVGTSIITIAINTAGFVQQTIKSTSGGFIASQMWTDTDSYTNGEFPNAATLKIAGDFVTVTVIPNKGAQIMKRDSQGRIKSYATILDAYVSLADYQNKSLSVSNADSHKTAYAIANNLGGITTYYYANAAVEVTTVTDDKKNKTVIVSSGNGSYHMATKNAKGEISEKDSSDPMGELQVTSPNPETMTQQTKQAASLLGTPQTLFSKAFAESGKMPVQILAVNRMLAIQYGSPQVLGAKTSTKTSVLGDHTKKLSYLPGDLAPPGSAPGEELAPKGSELPNPAPATIDPSIFSIEVPAYVAPSTPNTNTVPGQDVELTSGSTTIQVQGGTPITFTPAVGGPGISVEELSSAPAVFSPPAQVDPAGRGPDQDIDAPAAPAAPATNQQVAPAAPSSTPPSYSAQPSAPAAAASAATVSNSFSPSVETVAAPTNVTTSVTNRDGSTFSTDGITSTWSNPTTGVSVTAVGGLATDVTVGGVTYSLQDGVWSASDGSEVNASTASQLDSALQGQANASGVDQVSANQGTISPESTLSGGGGTGDAVQDAVGAAYGAEAYAADHPEDAGAQQNYLDAVANYESLCDCSYAGVDAIGQQETTTDAAPTDPGSTDPGSTDPGSTDPGSSDPGSSDPGSSDPGSSGY